MHWQVAPMPPWRPKIEKYHFNTVHKIITSGHIWIFVVSKQPYQSPNIIGLYASGATNSLVAKIGTKDLATSCSVNRIWNINGWTLMFTVLNDYIDLPNMRGSFANGATISMVAKNETKNISVIWRAKGLKFGIKAKYPQNYYWGLFWNQSE